MINLASRRHECVLLLLLFLGGCTLGHQSHKTEKSGLLNIKCNEIADEKHYQNSFFTSCLGSNNQNIDFSVIELDDYGEFWNPEQVTITLNRIKYNASEKPTVLFTFIHGWRNNASEKSDNLKDFRDLARSFAELDCGLLFPASSANCVKPNISAVYISWRGDPLGITQKTSNKLLKTPQYLTFWNRWRTSQKISNTNVTHLLLKLSGLVDEGDRERLEELNYRSCIFADYKADGNQCSKKIIIGHSFGGRILEHAVAQGFIGSRNLANKLDISGFVKDTLTKRKSIEKNIDEISKGMVSLDIEESRNQNLIKDLKETKENENKNKSDLDKIFKRKQNELEKIEDKDKGEFQALAKIFNSYINSSFTINYSLIESFINNECSFYSELSNKYELSIQFKKYYEEKLNCPKYKSTSDEYSRKKLSGRTQNRIRKTSCLAFKTINNELIKQAISPYDSSIKKIHHCSVENLSTIKKVKNSKQLLNKQLTTYHINEKYINFDRYLFQVKSSLELTTKKINDYYKSIPDFISIPKLNTAKLKNNLAILNSQKSKAIWSEISETDGSLVKRESKKITVSRHLSNFNKLTDEIESINDEIYEIENERHELELVLLDLTAEITLNQVRSDNIRKSVHHLNEDKKLSIQELTILAERFENLAYSIYQRPYDLAVLLNPANEALSTNMLVSAMCDSASYYRTRNQLGISPDPWMLAISSENDEATGYFYRVATRLNTEKRFFQEKPHKTEVRKSPFINGSFNCQQNTRTQYKLAHTPAPFIDLLQSHKLKIHQEDLLTECKDEFDVSSNQARNSISYGITQGFKYQNKINSNINCQKKEKPNPNPATGNSNIDELLIGSIDQNFLILNRQFTSFDTPDFWAFTVKENIIKDHNDIFNSKVGKLLGTLVKKFKSIGEQCLTMTTKYADPLVNSDESVCIFLNDPFLTQDTI